MEWITKHDLKMEKLEEDWADELDADERLEFLNQYDLLVDFFERMKNVELAMLPPYVQSIFEQREILEKAAADWAESSDGALTIMKSKRLAEKYAELMEEHL